MKLIDYLKQNNIRFEEKDGKITVGGSLYLEGTAITSLPDNLTVGGSLYLRGTAITSLPDNLTVGGSLDLRGTAITSLPDNLTVGGSLYLEGTAITSLPDNLTVGGSLDLRGTAITSLPDNLTVGEWLDLRGTAITSLPDNLTVGGSLDLEGTAITSLPDNLTVGGSLDLRGTAITSLPDNLTVGEWLDLRGTAITSLPDNLTVGGSLDLRGTAITDEAKEREKVKKSTSNVRLSLGLDVKLSWQNGKYRKIDGVFCEVIKNLKNAMKVKIKLKIAYVVTDGNVFSHGDTIKQAKESLIYKISSKDKSKFKFWTLSTRISLKEAIESYRVITGACEFGTKNFIEHLDKLPTQITPAIVIKLTKGQYGASIYADFFQGTIK